MRLEGTGIILRTLVFVYDVCTVKVRRVCANVVYNLLGVEDVPPFLGVVSYNTFSCACPFQ